jgi:hypothetical protein
MIDDDQPDDMPVENMKLVDPVADRLSRDKSKRSEQQRAGFWRSVFNDPVGRAEMWRLLMEDAGCFSPQFECGANGFPQPEATWFRAGHYALGQTLYRRWLLMARDGVLKMHEEYDPDFIRMKPKKRSKWTQESQ